MSETVKIGIIGCGTISQAYFDGAARFKILEVKACADINMEAAIAKAKENNLQAVTIDELLADPEIEIIVNLTIPRVHGAVSLQILNANKHVYSEKPLAVNIEDGKRILDCAKARNLRVGCAPDTFLGGGLQTCRKLIDDNWIGETIGGTAFMMSHGPEDWHPNPFFFYEYGGGPMFDIGPYYLTALVSLLGPVKRVCACTAVTFKERMALAKNVFGRKIPVEVPTHLSGVIEFHNGAIINMIMSFDVWGHQHSPIELYGTEGSMTVPNPGSFGGPVMIKRPQTEWTESILTHIYKESTRSIGVADMAYAIKNHRDHRCNGDMAYHVLEIMHSFEKSSTLGRHIDIESTCSRPSPLPLGLKDGLLDS